ncbi:hypothetical protein J3A84_10630 [Proteiniclasticum sp. SCR006]|uniref:Uncharacterized protein n=1 Tax=Proteiniclasticum aestuarii TaxID=2817862 RepID=A0A939H722_9CLOT|nr:hypothetical protein [Proteiniclasticum aestuarii]MBO1265487.1 hypothetical protein [Proteiniclasticum aestuarii]
MKKKNSILVSIAIIIIVIMGGYALYPHSLEDVVSSEERLYVLHHFHDVEDGEPILEFKEYEFEKGSEEAVKIREILGGYTYHRGLRILSWENDLGISGEGHFLQLLSGSNALSSGGTGEILLNSRIYSVDYWGRKNNRALLKEILDVLK